MGTLGRCTVLWGGMSLGGENLQGCQAGVEERKGVPWGWGVSLWEVRGPLVTWALRDGTDWDGEGSIGEGLGILQWWRPSWGPGWCGAGSWG